MNKLLLLAVLAVACGPRTGGVDHPAEGPRTRTTPVAEGGEGAPPPPTRTETLGTGAVTIEERIDDAAELLATQQKAAAERARAILLQVVAEQPSALAWFDLGVAHHQLGDQDEARRAYQEAVHLDPSLGDAWLYLGLIQEEAGRHDLALSNYRTGMRKDPDNMELRVALVSALRAQGKVDEAIEEARAALRVNADSLPIYNDLGLAYMDKGDLEMARFVYQKALNSIEGAAESAYIHANLGWVYFLRGDEGDALYYLQEAVKLDTRQELVPAMVYLSRIHLDNRNYPDAIPLLERAHERQPHNWGVALNLGIAYRGVGRLEDAERMYDLALELDPSDPAPYFNKGILYGDHLKDYARGIASFETYIDRRGPERDRAETYMSDLEKEQERAAKKAALEAERQKREEERLERERLLEEAERQQETAAPTEAAEPPPPQPEPAEPQPDDNPWGTP